MTFPAGVVRREITFTIPFDLIAGTSLKQRVTFSPTRSLRWRATDQIGVAEDYSAVSSGADLTSLFVPVTDQAGVWTDLAGNDVEPDAEHMTHAYDVKVEVLRGNRVVSTSGIITVAVESGVGPIALEDLVAVDGEGGTTVYVTDKWTTFLQEARDSAAAAGAAADRAEAATAITIPDDFVATMVATPGSASRMAMAAAFAQYPSNGLGLLGDSFIGRGLVVGASSIQRIIDGFWDHTLVSLRQGLRLDWQGGVAGDTTAQMLTRLQAYVAANGGVPSVMVLDGGVNDALNGVDIAVTEANLTTIFDLITQYGGSIVGCSIGPNTNGNDAQRATIAKLNNWLARQAFARRNFRFVNWHSLVSDAATGVYAAGMSKDDVHPTPQAAFLMGKKLADAIRPLIIPIDPLPNAGDPNNRAANPFMTGTTGTMGAGITGTVPTGIKVNPIGTTTAVCSIVPRTDGQPGSWLQVAVTAGGVSIQDTNSLVHAGDSIYSVWEFETNDDLATADGLYIRSKLSAVTQAFADAAATYDLSSNAGDRFPLSKFFHRSGVMASQPITVPAENPADTYRYLHHGVQVTTQGTVRVGRNAIYKVGSGPLW